MDANQFRDSINEIKTKIDTLPNKEIKDILNGLVNLIDVLYRKITYNITDSKRENTLLDLMKTIDSSKHSNVVMAIAFYLYTKGLEPFNVNDVKAMYDKARLTPPKNLNDIINKCAKRGLLIECKEKKDGYKAWKISKDGIEFVESLLRGEQA